jgi:hypothetical protein
MVSGGMGKVHYAAILAVVTRLKLQRTEQADERRQLRGNSFGFHRLADR